MRAFVLEAVVWISASLLVGCGSEQTSSNRVAAGAGHTCAVVDGGRVRCWGWNTDGDLGDGSRTYASKAVSVVGISDALEIAAGNRHSCAVVAGGTVRCWGSNEFGQLGNGAAEDSLVPGPVNGVTGAVAIAAGIGHSCAIVSKGAVECWGLNDKGQLGDGTTANSSVPVAVVGVGGATALAAGRRHTCAVLVAGAVKCWGANEKGELGDGTTNDASTPVSVVGLSGAVAVAVSGGDFGHSCSVGAGGQVQCWGSNTAGELGDGSTVDSSVPVVVKGVSGAIAVAAGAGHTCAIVGDGVRCWGRAGSGQLGNGIKLPAPFETKSPIPVDVVGLSGVIALSGGHDHNCVVVRDGSIHCWGVGAGGQLGTGSYTDYSTPVTVR
jgi:alpha-tubulin suppressor-like RCC1 family protein